MIASAPPSSVEVFRLADHTVARINDHTTLDEYNSRGVFQELSRLADEVATGLLVLDLDGIRYVTSAALGMLVSLNRKVRTAGGRLTLANAGEVVQETLAVTRLDQVIEVQTAA